MGSCCQNDWFRRWALPGRSPQNLTWSYCSAVIWIEACSLVLTWTRKHVAQLMVADILWPWETSVWGQNQPGRTHSWEILEKLNCISDRTVSQDYIGLYSYRSQWLPFIVWASLCWAYSGRYWWWSHPKWYRIWRFLEKVWERHTV